MGLFTNPFFSIAGQVERLTNAKDTIIAAVTGKVQSNTGISSVDKVLSTAASHPFLTAGVAAGAVNPSGALAAGEAAASKVATSFTGAKLSTQVLVVGGTIVGGSAVLNSKNLQSGLVNAPSGLANFGSNIGKAADNPSLSSVGTIYKENPVIATTATVLGGGALLGGIGSLASTAATALNTKSVNANTAATAGGSSGSASGIGADTSVAPSNGHDEDIAKANAKSAAEVAQIQADSAIKLAEIQRKAQQDTLDAQLKALAMQPVPAPAATKKKSTKKPKKKAKHKTSKRKTAKVKKKHSKKR